MSDFAKLAKKAAAEDKPVPVVPQGTWRLGIKGGGKYIERKGGKGNGPMADGVIPVTLIQPLEDVHPSDLEKLGDYGAITAFHRITIWDEPDFWNVHRFFNIAGHSDDDLNKKNRDELIASKGGEVVAYARHRANPDDPERPFVDFVNVVSAS